jgi:type I restriction enzyme, S subunit
MTIISELQNAESQLEPGQSRQWKSYEHYGYSGDAFLGQIPRHWQIKPLKHAVTINPEALREDTDPDYWLQYVDIGNVTSRGEITGTERIPFGEAPSRARRIAKPGDTFVSTVRTYLRAIGFIDDSAHDLVLSTGFAVLRSGTQLDPHFLCRLAQSTAFIEWVVAHSEGVSYPAITPTVLGQLPVPIPPFSEQKAIAAFLDRETERIDSLIAKKEQLIDLLEEKRAAFINHVVTKGLSADTLMKDSGIEWLGQIPESWNMTRLKFITSMVTSGSRGWAQHYSDDGAMFFRVGNIPRTSIDIDLSNIQRVTPPDGSEGERTRVKVGDVLLSITAHIGSVAVVQEDLGDAFVSQHLALIRPVACRISSRWLAYTLFSSVGELQFQSLLYGGTKDGLGLDDVESLVIPVPPPEEQAAICSHLDHVTANLADMIEKIGLHNEMLLELRTALISAAVTGQIDVCGEVAS